MSKESGAIIRNAVVTKVKVGQDLSLQDELSNLTGTTIADLVVRQVKLGNSLVQHEVLNQDLSQIIIDQVSWQRQVGQRCSSPQALAEVLGVGHLHAKHGALVAHANVLGSVSQLEEGQVRQEVEQI